MFQNHLKKAIIAILYLFFSIPLWAQSINEGVRVINQPNSPVMEIRNGLLGVVIPKQTTFDPKNAKNTLSPIQSIIYKDGTYSDDTPNYLQCEVAPVSMKVDIIKNTPDECIVKIRYAFNKPKFTFYGASYKGGDAGSGYYQTTINVKKGSKSVLMEEEADYDASYGIKIFNGLQPDKARYRGWSSSSAAEGYEPSGAQYRNEDQRAPLDATVDLSYDKRKLYPWMSLWDPSGGEINTGRYWQFYNSKAPEKANLMGFFQGKSSRLIGGRSGGVLFVIGPDEFPWKEDGAKSTAYIGVVIMRRGADNSWYPKKRFQWGLFVSTKADLLPPDKFQPIGKEMNYVSGLGSRIDEYAKKSVDLVPAFFDGSIYMSAKKIQDLIKRVKTDEAFYNNISTIDPYFKPILDVWRNPATADQMIKGLLDFGEQLKDSYKNGDGNHAINTQYWKGSYAFKKSAQNISCLFADKSIVIPPAKKEQLLQLVGLMARIQWDDDNVPFFDSSAINFGTANMAHQYQNNGRYFFAMLLAKDPEFSKRAAKIAAETLKELQGVIYANGSSFGSPHYIQTAVDPLLFSMLQLKQAGVVNLFVEQKTLLKKFIDFYCSLLTAPSVRFNNYRKLISFGDGSEESAVTFGLLASGFQDSDPALSEQLYNIFQNGAPRMSLFGDIAFSIEFGKNYPPTVKMSSSNFSGYLSHFRNAVNTNNETAAWIINGDGYFDHRNDDRGEVAIYALKAPLSLSRSSFYYPRADDSRIRSLVIPESEFAEWKTAEQPITSQNSKGPAWLKSSQIEFAKLGYSNISVSKMELKEKEWYRRVMMLTLLDEQPVILFYDSVNNKKPNIWSMLFMSEGMIKTTAGDVKPDDRVFDAKATLQELPRATPEKKLAQGLNKFSFTGQQWPQKTHVSGGINWDMFSVSNSSTSFTTSQWTTNWQNSQEAEEYQLTMGRPYRETQQILRIKSEAPFFHVLLPYFKGTEPYKDNVQLKGNNKLQIKYGKGLLLLTDDYYFYEGSDRIVASSFNSTLWNEKGFSIAGGIAEIVVAGNEVKIRVNGNSGKRNISLPFEIDGNTQNAQVKIQGKPGSSQLVIDYKSKGIDVLSTEQGYTEYTFKKK